MVSWTFWVAERELTVHSVPHNDAAQAAKAVVLSGHHMSYVTAKGKFFSTRCTFGTRHYGRRWQSHLSLIRDAIKLGLLPRKAMARLTKIEAARQKKRDASYAASAVLREIADTGVALTPNQQQRLKRIAAFKTRES